MVSECFAKWIFACDSFQLNSYDANSEQGSEGEKVALLSWERKISWEKHLLWKDEGRVVMGI